VRIDMRRARERRPGDQEGATDKAARADPAQQQAARDRLRVIHEALLTHQMREYSLFVD
jgi:hypothetical protein